MIKLKETVEVVRPYKGSSKFDFWKKIKERDRIEIWVNLVDPGRHGKNRYATTVYFKNLDNNETFRCSLSESVQYLSKIEYAAVAQDEALAHLQQELDEANSRIRSLEEDLDTERERIWPQ